MEARRLQLPSAARAAGPDLGQGQGPIDADLQVILERWPDLPDSVKADILAMPL